MPIVKPGVKCKIVGRMEDLNTVVFDGKGLNEGKIVTVLKYAGESDTIGNVWRCSSDKKDLVMYAGFLSDFLDLPEKMLEPLPEEIPPVKAREVETT